MKRFLFTIFLLGVLSPLAAQLYHPGEQLFYRVSYKAKMFPNTEGGTVEVSTSEETHDGLTRYKVVGAGRTLPTYRWFFNLEDIYTVWVAADELRPVRITRHFTDAPEGSVLIECGNTRVMCTATFTPGVPRWRKDSGLGWVPAEYSMLPRATAERTDRESVRGKIGGRTHEISRLIGRCLRGVIDMKALGENQIQLDCDVLQADGGTRTASVTGAYVALVDAVNWAEKHRHIKSASRVLKDYVSAVSVGVINGTPMLDLPYIEDSQAMTDMNVAMTGSGDFIEIQGTAEHRPFNRAELNTLRDLAEKGNRELQAAQRAALALD